MIGKDLVEPHGEQLRHMGRPEALGGEVAKVPALGEGERIAETEGHADRRHGVVMPGRVADQHAKRGAVSDARPQLIGCNVELPRPQRLDERRPESLRQQGGIGFRQEADPVLA